MAWIEVETEELAMKKAEMIIMRAFPVFSMEKEDSHNILNSDLSSLFQRNNAITATFKQQGLSRAICGQKRRKKEGSRIEPGPKRKILIDRKKNRSILTEI